MADQTRVPSIGGVPLDLSRARSSTSATSATKASPRKCGEADTTWASGSPGPDCGQEHQIVSVTRSDIAHNIRVVS
jgi:hypothetical protein